MSTIFKRRQFLIAKLFISKLNERYYSMNIKATILTILLLLTPFLVFSQADKTIVLKGTVLDAQANEPISSVSIRIMNKDEGTKTNESGQFTLVIKSSDRTSNGKIKVSCVGYKTEIIPFPTESKEIEIWLSSDTQVLNGVTVKKQKYRNKNNPAVELIQKVIANKSRNRKEALDYFDNEKYEKIQFALTDITPKFKQKRAFKKLQFMFESADSTQKDGKEMLPMYMKETISNYYYRKSPKNEKEVVTSNKKVSFEGIDNKGLEDNIKYLYQDINIYDNNIFLLTNQFLSPVAPSAPTFYRYYIMDTIQTDAGKCIKLFFGSRNKQDMLFQGFLYIQMDGSYAIKGVELTVNKNININWVKDLKVVQEFEKTDKGWLVSYDQTAINFGIKKKGQSLLGKRTVSYNNYHFTPPANDSIFRGPKLVVLDSANLRSNAYWLAHRHQILSKSEEGTYAIIDSVQNVPVFKRAMNIATVILFGYEDLGKFEIGPVNTFYQYNPIEGLRFRFGGRTTDKFNKRLNLESYAAYGFNDKLFKYYVGGSWSFTNRGLLDFPLKSIKMSYQDETQLPGQQMQFLMEDNFLLSVKRGVNDKLFYNKTLKIEHLNEFQNHFSYTLGYKFINQTPGGNLRFNYNDYLSEGNDVKNLNISEFYLNLKYAPHESFYQGKIYRIPFYNKYPIFELRINAGSKAWKNDYNYQLVRFSVRKRFYLSVLGYSDVVWEAGKLFGKVPYPLLNIPQANQTYSYQIESYNMMNFLEFVTDQYTSLLIDHSFNGFFFNKIPFMKQLNWREIVTCKILYGNVTKTNDPKYNTDLFRLPVEPDGTPVTYTLGKIPYIEGSIGIGNIFKFFRIDLVKRFTYLNNPNVSSLGIRMRFRFDF